MPPSSTPSDSPSEPTGPQDMSLTGVLASFEQDGRTGQFRPVEGGSIQCLTCRSEFAAGEVDAQDMVRLEGASDPDDMMMVVAVTCPVCGARGALVVAYGPDSSAADSDVVVALDRTPAPQRANRMSSERR